MNDSFNIEDLFRREFDNYHVKPSEKTWNNISSNLWFLKAQNLLKNYTIEPGQYLWRNISFKLFINSYFSFKLNSINIYYTLLIFAPLIYLLTQNKPLDKPIYPREHSYSLNANRPVFSNPDNYLEEKNNQLADYKEKNIIDIESINQSHQQKTTPLGSLNNTNIKADKPDNLNKVSSKKINKLSYEQILTPGLTKYDTIAYNFKQEPIIIKPWNFYLTLSASSLFSNNETLIFKEIENNQQEIHLPSKNSWSTSAGFYFSAKHYNAIFETGLTVSQFNQTLTGQALVMHFDTIHTVDYKPVGYYEYQSHYILDLDALILGDTVYIELIDSTYCQSIDTIEYSKIIASKENINKEYTHYYRYFEVPVIAGYNFNSGRFDIALKGGLIGGFLIDYGGKLPSPYSDYYTSKINDNHARIKKFIPSALLGVELSYALNNRFSLTSTISYRQSFSSVFKKEALYNEKLKSFELLKIGLRYKLK